MDQPNYHAIPGAGAGGEKETSTPRLTQLPCYYATYSSIDNAPAVADACSRRRARARFLLAFAFAGLLLGFLRVGLGHFKPFPHAWTYGRHRQHNNHLTSSYLPNCSDPAVWTYNPNGSHPVNGFLYLAEASFQLPVSADVLFFTAEGYAEFAHGIIEIIYSSETPSNNVTVNITGYYNDLGDFQNLTEACLLNPEKAKYGVGIFAPTRWPQQVQQRQVLWYLKVILPKPLTGSSLSIKKFETTMPFFLHNVGDIAQSVFFDTLLLQSANTPVNVMSVTGRLIDAKTSNAPIIGSFNTTECLDISTFDAPVDVRIGMFNNGTKVPTKLSIQSTNGPVISNMSLFSTSANRTNGTFIVDIRSLNSPLNAEIAVAPVDHTLNLKAYTTNAPPRVKLPTTYEGTFELSCLRFIQPVISFAEDPTDPAGQGRHRNVTFSKLGGGVAEGSVQWLPSNRTTPRGSVQVTTINMGINLDLPA